MKIFRKILIGLCSLLPCFGAVRSRSSAEALEIQKRNYHVQAVNSEPSFDCTFFGSDSITQIVSTQNLKWIPNIKLKIGIQFRFNLGNKGFACTFKIAPTKCIWAGVMLYSPAFDGVKYFPAKVGLNIRDDTNHTVVNSTVTLGDFHPSLVTSVFDYESVQSSSNISQISFSCILNDSLNNINEDNNYLFALPVICTSGIFSETLIDEFNSVISLWFQGLQGGFLQGMQYHKSIEKIDYSGYYQQGYTDGKADGYKTGQIDGMNSGKEIGYKNGYKAGYDIGYSKGSDSLTPFTTISSLFGAIASVPTEILNGMADLSIWNTSILAVLFTLLFLALVLWIIRKFI